MNNSWWITFHQHDAHFINMTHISSYMIHISPTRFKSQREWVKSHVRMLFRHDSNLSVNESRDICESCQLVRCEWFFDMIHISPTRLKSQREWVKSYMWKFFRHDSHLTLNESSHTCALHDSHFNYMIYILLWMSEVRHVDVFPTWFISKREWVKSHMWMIWITFQQHDVYLSNMMHVLMWMSGVTHVNAFPTWFASHLVNESRDICESCQSVRCERVMSHKWIMSVGEMRMFFDMIRISVWMSQVTHVNDMNRISSTWWTSYGVAPIGRLLRT